MNQSADSQKILCQADADEPVLTPPLADIRCFQFPDVANADDFIRQIEESMDELHFDESEIGVLINECRFAYVQFAEVLKSAVTTIRQRSRFWTLIAFTVPTAALILLVIVWVIVSERTRDAKMPISHTEL